MPKIVDHDQRRDEIALVACRVVAEHGFDQATIVRIAREAGYTTGMVAHYFDTKQEIIIAALRLILRRIEERLTRPAANAQPDLLTLLAEALPVDEHRYTECAFWTAFWGQVSADKRLKRINGWCTASTCACSSAVSPKAGRNGRNGSLNKLIVREAASIPEGGSIIPRTTQGGVTRDCHGAVRRFVLYPVCTHCSAVEVVKVWIQFWSEEGCNH